MLSLHGIPSSQVSSCMILWRFCVLFCPVLSTHDARGHGQHRKGMPGPLDHVRSGWEHVVLNLITFIKQSSFCFRTPTLGSHPRLLIWIGCVEEAAALGAGLGAGWAALTRRVAAAAAEEMLDAVVAMTMPVRGVVCIVLPDMGGVGLGLQGCPLTMRTWWIGAAEDGSEEAEILVASITGRCSNCGAAIMGGGGAGAMGTLVGVAGLGLTYQDKAAKEQSTSSTQNTAKTAG